MKKNYNYKFFIDIFSAILIYCSSCFYAQAGLIPESFYHAAFGSSVPDLSNLKHLRFLTTENFPPFNYRPQSSMPLAGYNIDLMRAICRELNMLPKCQVEPVEFDQLIPNLRNGEGDAVIAGLTANAPDIADDITFSVPYMMFPARFLCLSSRLKNGAKLADNIPIDKQKIGVLHNSKHVAMLRSYFPNIIYTEYSDNKLLFKDLQSGKIDAIFGDGRVLAAVSGDYNFEGEAYYNQNFLGAGMRVAVLSKRADILNAINYAIEKLANSGELYMIYLRYFPRNFY